MPYSSFTIHPSQNRSADEDGESSLRSYLFLPSGDHQKYLVETNKPVRIWPIHGTIRYKIKQKSLFNSKLWSDPVRCQNNNINLWVSQSRWERSSCQGSTVKEQKNLQQLGPAWMSYLFLWDSLRRCLFWWEFLHWKTPELQGKGHSQSQVDWLRRFEASRIFPSTKVLRANRKLVLQLALLEHLCPSPLLPPALTLVYVLRRTWRFLGWVCLLAQRVSW